MKLNFSSCLFRPEKETSYFCLLALTERKRENAIKLPPRVKISSNKENFDNPRAYEFVREVATEQDFRYIFKRSRLE